VKLEAPATEDGARSGADRQRDYHAAMRARGYTRVSTWVPDYDREAFNAAVRRLQKKWNRESM